jgi:transposase
LILSGKEEIKMVQGKEKTMAEKRQILIELRKGTPIRKISRELRVHRDVIRTLIIVAASQNWLNPSSQIPSEAEIAFVVRSNHKPVHELDAHLDKIQVWYTEKYSAIVIQRMLHEHYNYPVQIGALRRYMRKHIRPIPDPVMVRSVISGKTMEVDFGFLGYLFDPSTNKKKKAWVFSARLRHSRKSYRRIVQRQDTTTFLLCHVHAFEHFGGVPEEVVLDNLKAAVIHSCVDNDMLNRSYYELASHYDFRINPCLPGVPEHKGGVENDMKYVKRNYWPQIREKLKTNPEFSFHQAQEALEQWDREVASKRKIRGIDRSPEEIFESEEKYFLKKLPDHRWEGATWTQCTVGRD